jgi:predicted RNase H-like nuclease
MGLTDAGSRPTDVLARRFVGAKRASSIFPAPVRGILDATSQAEASSRHRAIDGRGYGAQAFAILAHIRAWDSLLRSDSALPMRVYEIHPEVSFAAMNDGAGLVLSKKTRDGARYRATLLCDQFGAAAVSNLVEQVSKRDADPDDVLDALAAFWSAQRIADGTARSLPAAPAIDSEGLRIAIHY